MRFSRAYEENVRDRLRWYFARRDDKLYRDQVRFLIHRLRLIKKGKS